MRGTRGLDPTLSMEPDSFPKPASGTGLVCVPMVPMTVAFFGVMDCFDLRWVVSRFVIEYAADWFRIDDELDWFLIDHELD